MPTYGRRLINASAVSSVFKLYVVLVWVALLYLSFFSGLNLPNQYDNRKNNYGHNDKEKPQETEDELSRVIPSVQEGLKHRLVAVDAVPVLIRYS